MAGEPAAWSYTRRPADSARDAVRFWTGQVSTNDPLLVYDAEIDFALTQYPNTYLAAALIADGLFAQYKTLATTKRVGQLELSYSNRSKDFATLAMQLRREGVMRGAGFFVGGQSHSAAAALASNADQVLPNFTIGMDDNPLAPDPNVGTSATT